MGAQELATQEHCVAASIRDVDVVKFDAVSDRRSL